MGIHFGTDGIRGIANRELCCEDALSVGRALGHILSSNRKYKTKILVGMDTRISSGMLAEAMCAGISSVGADAVLLGIIPTPAVAYLTVKYGAKAGVIISASHNPYEYNGIKIFGEDGFKLSDELEERIESLVADKTITPSYLSPYDIGRITVEKNAVKDYTKYLQHTADVSLSGLRIAVDCANGSAYEIAEKLFPSLGTETFFLNNTPDGKNINRSCGSTDLSALSRFVIDNKLDLGIAFDGDADRCLAVDNCGCEVDGDIIMAILALYMKKTGDLTKNTVVGTVMTNYGFQKFCRDNGITFKSTRVGDRYVSRLIEDEGYSFGGEQSGHIIIRKHATTGDGLLTAVKLLCCLKKSKKPLSGLSAVMKKYPQYTLNIPANAEQKLALLTDGEIKDILTKEDEALAGRGRVVVRASGTEPLIRIMAECDCAGEPEVIVRRIAELIEKRLISY